MKMNKKATAVCGIAIIIGIALQRYPNLRTSEQGQLLIGNAESCLREPYYCPAGILTVGIGSTAASGMPIQRNKRYSDIEIAQRWAKDLEIAEDCVNLYANGKAMPQGAFDALTSITFNVGCSKLKNSSLFKMARMGYSQQMCNQFGRWIYANGKPLNGLIERRKKETALCLQGN